MKLLLLRDGMARTSTLGKLFVNGTFQCFTLEDPIRAGAKIPGETGIGAGTYKVVFTDSGRFGKDWPLLQDVPNFTAVRIHGGNAVGDTEGCILVGMDRVSGMLMGSQKALQPLLALLRAARGEGIEIEIVNGRNPVV